MKNTARRCASHFISIGINNGIISEFIVRIVVRFTLGHLVGQVSRQSDLNLSVHVVVMLKSGLVIVDMAVVFEEHVSVSEMT